MESRWPYSENSRREMLCPFCGSILLHAGLFLLLTSSPPLDPVIGQEISFDLFWASPADLAPPPSPPAVAQQSTTEALPGEALPPSSPAEEEELGGQEPLQESSPEDGDLELVVPALPPSATTSAPPPHPKAKAPVFQPVAKAKPSRAAAPEPVAKQVPKPVVEQPLLARAVVAIPQKSDAGSVAEEQGETLLHSVRSEVVNEAPSKSALPAKKVEIPPQRKEEETAATPNLAASAPGSQTILPFTKEAAREEQAPAEGIELVKLAAVREEKRVPREHPQPAATEEKPPQKQPRAQSREETPVLREAVHALTGQVATRPEQPPQRQIAQRVPWEDMPTPKWTPPEEKPAPTPVQVVPRPVQAVPKPVQAVPKPVQAAPKPVQAVPKPVQAAPKPVQAVPKPAPKPAQPVPKVAQTVPKVAQTAPKLVKSAPAKLLSASAEKANQIPKSPGVAAARSDAPRGTRQIVQPLQVARQKVAAAATSKTPAPPNPLSAPAVQVASSAANLSAAGAQSDSGTGSAPATAAVPAPRQLKAEGKAKPEAKPVEPRGVVIPYLHGDLKMVIAGDPTVRLLVSFRDYPKSRRKKPLSRAESRREQKITPLYAKTREESREAVIESAREGIYTFSVESEKGEATRAIFTLKIFETAPRARVAKIGARTITGKTVVARVLMPEGILWDDDSAFTGSMEDSESITKFNAETGVYWKEYND